VKDTVSFNIPISNSDLTSDKVSPMKDIREHFHYLWIPGSNQTFYRKHPCYCKKCRKDIENATVNCKNQMNVHNQIEEWKTLTQKVIGVRKIPIFKNTEKYVVQDENEDE